MSVYGQFKLSHMFFYFEMINIRMQRQSQENSPIGATLDKIAAFANDK